MNESSATDVRRTPSRRPVVWFLAAMLVGGLVCLAAMRFWWSDGIPPLKPQQFHAAREQWTQHAVPDYDIEVAVAGTQPATYEVRVRDGQAIEAFRNGKPLNQRRTFGTWSVPGMFSTMSRDVEAVERRERGEADPSTPRLTLRAEFDPKYGYPKRYQRIEWGSPVEVTWQVTHFEPK